MKTLALIIILMVGCSSADQKPQRDLCSEACEMLASMECGNDFDIDACEESCYKDADEEVLECTLENVTLSCKDGEPYMKDETQNCIHLQ